MANTDTFSGYHPTVNFIYFALVLFFGMIFMHPACLAIALFGAAAYAVRLTGRKAVSFGVKFILPVVLLAVVINPAFNHAGETVLLYLSNGNPITKESIAYGFAAGAMLALVLMWFYCSTEVLSSDKFVYIFGRVSPSLALILSMTLRFVPKFKKQLDLTRQARRSVGCDTANGSVLSRTKNAITVLSGMITWSLENAIDTADSMKSRGYGLKHRSSFSIYRFDRRDRLMLVWLLLCGGIILLAAFTGGLGWRYFPNIRGALSPMTICALAAYLALCLTPTAIDLREERRWKSLISKT